MAARDVPVRARARRSKVGMYAGSLPWGPIPSVLRRQDAATVLIHGCGSSATSCGSVACVVVILSKAREAMRSVCAVSWLKEFGRRTSLFAVRKGRGARGGRADRGRSCPTMPPSVRTSDKTSNQDTTPHQHADAGQKSRVGRRSPEFAKRGFVPNRWSGRRCRWARPILGRAPPQIPQDRLPLSHALWRPITGFLAGRARRSTVVKVLRGGP